MVHIPKTGGTTLEMLAASSGGIAWSYCHWGDTDPCPPHPRRIYDHHVYRSVKNWHVPPIFFDSYDAIDEYDDDNDDDDDDPLSTATATAIPITPIRIIPNIPPAPFNPYRNASLFVVVRNPYDRAVSEFKYRAGLKGWNPNNVDKMNDYLLKKLHKVQNATIGSKRYFTEYGHFIPQYDFTIQQQKVKRKRKQTRHNSTTTTTDNDYYLERIPNMHIVHLERLGEEFTCLVRRYYGLLSRIDTSPLTRTSSRANKSKGNLLSARNLTMENRELIESIFANDFQEFGYEKMNKND